MIITAGLALAACGDDSDPVAATPPSGDSGALATGGATGGGIPTGGATGSGLAAGGTATGGAATGGTTTGGTTTGGTTTGGTTTGGTTAGRTTTSNRGPVISGVPSPSVAQGTNFSFRPSASDPDGDKLSFSIWNRPQWATFDSSTGLLRGKPTANDVGTYSSISIRVSDGRRAATLGPFSVKVVGTATGSIALSWEPPTERTDGTALTNLAGYKIYWGTAPDDLVSSEKISSPGVVRYVIEPLTPGTYYLAMTAFDSDGVESSHSNVASKTID